MLVPSATGLTNSGNGQLEVVDVGHLSDQGKVGRGHASLPDHGFRQVLVQRQRHHQRVGERVSDVVQVEDRRDLRFPGVSVQAFGNIEHQLPTVPCGQAFD